MVVDPALEQRLRRDLRAQLDGAVGPHPAWADSPVAQRIRDEGSGAPADRRRARRTMPLLLAAALSGVVLAGVLMVGGALQQRTENPPSDPPTTSPTTPSPSPSVAVVVTAPSPSPSAPVCDTTWIHAGTRSPVGLVDGIRIDEFDGSEGELFMQLPHGLDTVKRILVEPARLPFRSSTGAKVTVAGSAFFQLTIDGLTKPTAVNDRMLAGKLSPPFRNGVSAPIAEMRRLRKPVYRSPLVGPGRNATEVWAIGLTKPSCITVRTARDPYIGDDPGDNVLIVHFEPIRNPVLIPEPILLPSPTPSPAAGSNP